MGATHLRTESVLGQIAVLLALVLLAVSMAGAAQADVPEPLMQMTFDEGFDNAGTIGGEARVEVYAENEGPFLTPGPWGDCLDLTAASRFGGTLGEQTPAGCALLFSSPELDSLRSFTVALWMRPTTEVRAVSSRLLTKFGSWEILYSGGRPNFLAVSGEEKHGYRFPASASGRAGSWMFVAASIDVNAGQIRLSLGDRDFGLREPTVLELTHKPAQSDGDLQIGNFNGIRPFKGWIDDLRIYDVALTPEQVAEILEEDVANWFGGRMVYEYGVPSVKEDRFEPKQSAIFLSSRWQGRKKDETFAMLRDFHVSHLHWVYGSDPEYIRQVRELGVFYQAAVNGLCAWNVATPEPSARDDTTGRQQDLDGSKVIMPHMAKWSPQHPRWMGCSNNPDFRKLFWEETAQLVAGGVDSIHVDDWEMTLNGAQRGDSCFCPACIAGFREYLRRTLSHEELRELGIEDVAAFDYRSYLKTQCGIENAKQYKARFRELPLTPHFLEFQRQGLRDFCAAFRRHLDTRSAEKYIPVSVNLHFGKRGPDDTYRGAYCVDRLDFLVGEASLDMQNAIDYIQPCKLAEAFGITQVMQTKPITLAPAQAALATTYALGQWFRVPWDLYMGNDPTGHPAPRYMGTREDWGHLYDFVHENPQLFDGYQAVATVGVLFNADEAPYDPVRSACQRLAEQQAPFRLIAAAAKSNRIPVDAELLNSLRYLIELSSMDSYCEEDRETIQAAKGSRRIRFLSRDDDVLTVLENAGLPCLRVEGPRNVYALVRVKADAEQPSAVIHVVNWNVLPDGSGPDPFEYVTLSLSPAERWGKSLRVKYYRPAAEQAVELQPEVHRDLLRITIPWLETWGVVELRPRGSKG